jgi:hypothetical protein
VVLSWKWAEKGGGRQRRTQDEIFSAGVRVSDDVESDVLVRPEANSTCCGATPPKTLLALFCALDFPFAAGAGSLGGLCCSCTE